MLGHEEHFRPAMQYFVFERPDLWIPTRKPREMFFTAEVFSRLDMYDEIPTAEPVTWPDGNLEPVPTEGKILYLYCNTRLIEGHYHGFHYEWLQPRVPEQRDDNAEEQVSSSSSSESDSNARRQRAIHHNQIGFIGFDKAEHFLDLAFAEIRRGPDLTQGRHDRLGHREIDSPSQTGSFLKPRVGIAHTAIFRRRVGVSSSRTFVRADDQHPPRVAPRRPRTIDAPVKVSGFQTSDPVLTFVSFLSLYLYECRNQRITRIMIASVLSYPTFAPDVLQSEANVGYGTLVQSQAGASSPPSNNWIGAPGIMVEIACL